MTHRRKEISAGVVIGDHHTLVQNKRVRCDICPRYCTLHEGQRGFCFVRKENNGKVVLTSYGQSTGFCIDPIEKKPLSHFYPGTSVLSFGTAGCNLGCHFCQNWDISKAREMTRLSATAYPDAIALEAIKAGCKSVAFTYNDPVIFHEYAVDTAMACRDRDVQAVAVTAGYVSPQARKTFFANMDAANIDLKAFTEDFYQKLCAAHLDPVLDTLRYVHHETPVWLEITTLMIPDANDSDDEIKRLCDWLVEHLSPSIPLHLSAFHPAYRMHNTNSTPVATLLRARTIALSAGLRYVYTGNIRDLAGQSTHCHRCRHLLIERDAYKVGAWGLEEARCEQCQTVLPGRFDSVVGSWDGGRSRLHLAP